MLSTQTICSKRIPFSGCVLPACAAAPCQCPAHPCTRLRGTSRKRLGRAAAAARSRRRAGHDAAWHLGPPMPAARGPQKHGGQKHAGGLTTGAPVLIAASRQPACTAARCAAQLADRCRAACRPPRPGRPQPTCCCAASASALFTEPHLSLMAARAALSADRLGGTGCRASWRSACNSGPHAASTYCRCCSSTLFCSGGELGVSGGRSCRTMCSASGTGRWYDGGRRIGQLQQPRSACCQSLGVPPCAAC